MFGFGKLVKDPLADPKSALRWMASFPANDPLTLHAALVQALGHVAARDTKRHPAGFEALLVADEHAASLRRTLTLQYIDHASRSTRIENQLWQALFDLTQSFLLAYQAFARELMANPESAKWQAMLPTLALRQIEHLGEDAKIRLYRFEQWIPAKWVELHDLFKLTCAHKIERQPQKAATNRETTVEQEYLRVLLLFVMNAGNVAPRQLEWVAQQLPEWSAALRFNIASSSLATFYVDLSSRTGLKRRIDPTPLEGNVLFVDLDPLHALLVQHIVVLEQKLKSSPLSERAPRRTEQLNLLVKLALAVDPAFKPAARKGERSSEEGACDAIAGFANIAAFLWADAESPSVNNKTAAQYGDTIELATFGHLRNADARRDAAARRQLEGHAAPGGPWQILDKSITGYRLVAPMSVLPMLTLGSLVAIRPTLQPTWILGIVRRMKRMTAERAEIGLQVIATSAVSVAVQEQRPSDPGYFIDVDLHLTGSRVFQGLYLSLKKRENDPPVHTLIVPAHDYQTSKRYRLTTGRSTFEVSFGRLLEQQPEWHWTTIESRGAEMQRAAAG